MSNRARERCTKVEGNGRLFVVSAPAGTGKTTLVTRLATEFPNVKESISYTTRPQRAEEREGKHYHFVSPGEFRQREANGEFLESVTFLGNHYGTSLDAVREQQKQGNHVVLTIDTQGALLLMEKFDAVFIFLKPPSMEELQRRLVERKTESNAAIEQRLQEAEQELSRADRYDYHIVNDDLEVAYEVLSAIIIAELHRVRKDAMSGILGE